MAKVDTALDSGQLGQTTTFAARLRSSNFLRQFRRSRHSIVSLFVLLLFVIGAVGAPVLAPHDPIQFDLLNSLAPMSFEHPLGTDELGRDTLSRMLYGSRITFLITFGAVLIALAIGTVLGTLAGYRGGYTDTLIMRFIDILLAMPMFLLAVVIIAALGPSVGNVVLAVGIGSVPAFARIARGSTMSVKHEDYVLAVRAVGAKDRRIIARHVLPNVLPPLLVQSTLRLATAILTASGLSFLGLGPQPPTAEWGAMLSAGRNYMTSSPQLIIIPGVAILLVTVAFNLVGDGLRDALDPRLRR